MTTFETPPTRREGPRIYIPQEQGGPVIPPGTEFPLRRLLLLAGLQWIYSTPPPHGLHSQPVLWPFYMSSARTALNTPLLVVIVQLLPWEHVCFQSRYSVTYVVYLLISQSLPSKWSICHSNVTRRLKSSVDVVTGRQRHAKYVSAATDMQAQVETVGSAVLYAIRDEAI
jgi:hypothetical protein